MKMKNQIRSGVQETSISKREQIQSMLARRLAAEGMVLLKNDGLLPLAPSTSLALFGGGADKTVKGGIGSGDVNNRETISICRGLREAGTRIVSQEWIADYEKRYQAARQAWKEKILKDAEHTENPFDAYASNPFSMPEGDAITPKDLEGAQTAVYVISRISGEGKDRRKEEGDYYLSKKEREDILFLNKAGIPVVLILNVGAPVELTDIVEEAENIRAVLHICLPGQEGGRAAADVLFGRSVPGGRLTATWAKRYEDYPSAQSFGCLDGNLETEEYREGIYVGYRYFDSMGIEPLYSFGYGLSYTDFSITFEGLARKDKGVEITVRVENIGEKYEGKEVVQVYVAPPQTGMAKECRRLAGFAKTKVLHPKEVQKLCIFLEQKQLASYSEQDSAWIVEAGDYGIWIGNHLASLKLAALLTVPEACVIERTRKIGPSMLPFRELDMQENAKRKYEEWMRAAEEERVMKYLFTPHEEGQKVVEMPYAEGVPAKELLPLLYGNITPGGSTLGSSGIRVPGSAGETTEAWEKPYGIRSLIMADGPAGLRLRQSYEVDQKTGAVFGTGVFGSLENGFLEESKKHENADTYYQYCTAFPVGTALAQTWDPDWMRRFGSAVAEEMEEFHVDLWLAPGMNIHRNPLCGRNFEYFSEDPYLSGVLASAVTDGVQSHRGCGVVIKHFACNNQEDNRMGVDVQVSERALREIYLRGFEIAVKKSIPAAIMSSYNRVNGVHAANSRELCTVVAREEWGFGGVIMSDWNTTVPEDGSVPWMCADAGNDLIMPGNPEDAENIRQAFEQGRLSEEKVRSCAGRMLALIRRLADGAE